MGYPVYIQGAESIPAEPHWQTLPESLKRELLAYIDQYQSPPPGQLDGPCFWLDEGTRLCKHHSDRPEVCRRFAVGGKGCFQWRAFYRDKIEPGK